MKFEICTMYACNPSTTIDLPVKSWDDVKEWFVKWDRLHYTLDGEQWHEVELSNETLDAIDWKRPDAVEIYNQETGEILAKA